ncbi:hypothetical protein CCP3SC15_810010 [Gammaproteobacteria bacterium]
MDRKRIAGDTRPPVPDYTTIDLTARHSQNHTPWSFSAAIRNLLNAAVLEPSLFSASGQMVPNDLPMAPRSFWLQATYTR